MNNNTKRALLLVLIGSFCAVVGMACPSSEDFSSEPFFTPPNPQGPAATGAQNPEEYDRAYGYPPAISGGTLLVTHNSEFSVASDPDLDLIYVVDINSEKLVHTLEMDPGSEPGRLVEDAQGNIHVAARSGGFIATLNPREGTWLRQQNVCSTPRGMAYEESTDEIWLACAGGTLMKLPAAGGEPTLNVFVEEDLRDVVLDNGNVMVSRFKTAEVLILDRNANEMDRWIPQDKIMGSVNGAFGEVTFKPAVAWRMVPHPDGGALVLHQRGMERVAQTFGSNAYYAPVDPCIPGLVHVTVSRVNSDGSSTQTAPPAIIDSLSVDLAVTPSGDGVTIASAHTQDTFFQTNTNSIVTVSEQALRAAAPAPSPNDGFGSNCDDIIVGNTFLREQTVGVAYAPNGKLIVKTRAQPKIYISENNSLLSAVSLQQTTPTNAGHALFHAETGSTVSCASCHPEGREDGRTWDFGYPRRTQPLNIGGLKGTEPLHWAADVDNMSHLVQDVFVQRMFGTEVHPVHAEHMDEWLVSLQPIRTGEPMEQESIDRGEVIYIDTGCADCHSGAKLTNNETTNVGTGQAMPTALTSLQVPSLLGISMRAPFMHSGCAPTLEARFTDTNCGGGDAHGYTSELNEQEIIDLVNYLKTL